MNKSFIKLLTDFGPLLIFFIVYYRGGKDLQVAIPPLIVATIVAVIIVYYLEKKIPYMDAVIKFCEENDIDTATVGPLINKSLKEKIKIEAEKLNLVEKSSTAVLPI